MREMKFIKKTITKALALSASFCMFFSMTACDLGNIASKDEVKTKAEAAAKAALQAVDNVTDTIDTTSGSSGEEEKEIEFKTKPFSDDVGLGGFGITNPHSFASKAEGLYRVVSEEDSIDEERIEIYNVGDNLYALYSGVGFYAMEIFPAGDKHFDDVFSDSLPVKTVEFSMQSNFGKYWDNGVPTYMNMALTKTGIEFTVDQSSSVNAFGKDKIVLERIDEEMGYLSPFDYRNKEKSAEVFCKELGIETTSNIPSELLGCHIPLGDAAGAMMFEFTKEGLVQAYKKYECNEVLLYRGTFAVGKEKVGEGTNIYLSLMQMGYTAEPNKFNFCYKTEDKNLIILSGNTDYGEDALWNGAWMLNMTTAEIGICTYDENKRQEGLYGLAGSYYTQDGRLVCISSEGDFVYYPSGNVYSDDYIMGSLEKTDSGYDIKTANGTIGNIVVKEMGMLVITINGVTYEFTMRN